MRAARNRRLTTARACKCHSCQLFRIWRESQDFQPFLPGSRFYRILAEFFETLCKAKIIACNFTIIQSNHHELKKIFLSNTNTLSLSAFALVGKLVYLSSANHGQANLHKAGMPSVCQPKLPSKRHKVFLYLCTRLYFAAKDGFGFRDQKSYE